MKVAGLAALLGLLFAAPILAEVDTLVAEVDLKFIKVTEQVTAVICYGDADEDCHPWAYGYLWEARLRRAIHGHPPGKKFLVLYGRHALMEKDQRGVVGKFSRLTDGTDGAQYQLVDHAEDGRLACFSWSGRDGSGPAEQPISGKLLHCFDPEDSSVPDDDTLLANPEQSLRAANEAYNQAIIAGDIPALERIFSQEFIYTAPDGEVRDKAAQLELFKSNRLDVESGKGADERIQVQGKTGIVTGRFDANGKYAGAPFAATERYTSVWIVRDDRWQLLAEQGTLLVRRP